MIQLQRGELNNMVATCTRNKSLSGNVTFLFSFSHKLTKQSWKFIPFRVPPSLNYSPSYDLFTVNIDYTSPEVFTASTSANTANVHLLDGDYFVKIYEQYSTTNLNPQLSYDVVYEGTSRVYFSGSPENELISYTGGSEVFKIYNSQ